MYLIGNIVFKYTNTFVPKIYDWPAQVLWTPEAFPGPNLRFPTAQEQLLYREEMNIYIF